MAFGDGERTLKVAVGLEFIAVQRTSGNSSSRVSWAGRFSDGHLRNTDARPSDLRVVSELDGMKLASLTAGAFHCCALRDEGSLYVFGDEYGADESNGNLLGLGPRNETSVTPGPRWHRATRVSSLPPVTSVAASTYSTVAIATEGAIPGATATAARWDGPQRTTTRRVSGRFERRLARPAPAPCPTRTAPSRPRGPRLRLGRRRVGRRHRQRGRRRARTTGRRPDRPREPVDDGLALVDEAVGGADGVDEGVPPV